MTTYYHHTQILDSRGVAVEDVYHTVPTNSWDDVRAYISRHYPQYPSPEYRLRGWTLSRETFENAIKWRDRT